jgi:hypothetical protein
VAKGSPAGNAADVVLISMERSRGRSAVHRSSPRMPRVAYGSSPLGSGKENGVGGKPRSDGSPLLPAPAPDRNVNQRIAERMRVHTLQGFACHFHTLFKNVPTSSSVALTARSEALPGWYPVTPVVQPIREEPGPRCPQNKKGGAGSDRAVVVTTDRSRALSAAHRPLLPKLKHI